MRRKANPVVSRKQPKSTRPSFKSQKIQKNWNYSKTLNENYKDLGLKVSLNQDIKSRSFSKQIHQWTMLNPKEALDADISISQEQIYQQLGSILDQQQPTPLPSQDKSSIVAEFEMENASATKPTHPKNTPAFVTALVEKYGTDFKRMAMDTQLNRRQLSQGQLKRLLQA